MSDEYTPLQAFNTFSAEYEQCTVGSHRPYFEDDPVRIGTMTLWIDTVDVDGDVTHCRLRTFGRPPTGGKVYFVDCRSLGHNIPWWVIERKSSDYHAQILAKAMRDRAFS